MLASIPSLEDLTALIGPSLYDVWHALCAAIEDRYDMNRLWDSGGKKWTYEYKYRRGGKTLCALYAKERACGILIIFGRAEREKFEASCADFSEEIQRIYRESETYHDGKWMMIPLRDRFLFDDLMKLLRIKRRPNKQ